MIDVGNDLNGCEIAPTRRIGDVMPGSPVVSDSGLVDPQPITGEHAMPGWPAPDPAVQAPAAARARPALDVRRLRHPSEPSRFALAASASILLVGLGLVVLLRLAGVLALAGLGASLLMTLGLVWWAVQVHRAKLLGAAARVTPETFPALSAAARDVKQQVGYTRPVEIFVIAHTEEPARLTSFFGTHILLMEGDLVADLVKPENRPQLDFILATFFGKLKVKALAWAPLLIAIDALQLPRVLNFLIAPWQRATVYTGDQVAAACCGSLDESIIALNRLLVGKDLAQSVGMNGLMTQAATVRRRWLPRLQQLYSSYPHLTNRYLNLLSFAGQSAPGQAYAFRGRLSPATNAHVNDVSARLARLHLRGPRRAVAVSSIVASTVLLALAAFAIFFLVPQNDLVTLGSIFSNSAPSPAVTTPGPAVTSPAPPAPSATVSPSPGTPSDPAAALESHVPAAFAGTCSPLTPQATMTGVVAVIGCAPTGAGDPSRVQYYQYDNAADMNAAFDNAVGGTTEDGTCDQGGQRGTYQFTNGPGAGSWACFYNTSGEGDMMWTSTGLDILAVATDPVKTPQQLHDWFFSPADTGPD
ncbi:MAG TPA: hypothetical protein VGF32_33700 [Streptosporangiaceae bacterium]